MKKFWFKAKNYGYGWYPSSWEGWLVLFVYVAINILNLLRIKRHLYLQEDILLHFIPQMFLLTLVLIWVCVMTGEKAEWKWGKKN